MKGFGVWGLGFGVWGLGTLINVSEIGLAVYLKPEDFESLE